MIPANGPVAVCTAPQQDSLRLEKSAISKKFRASLGVIRYCPRIVYMLRLSVESLVLGPRPVSTFRKPSRL